jgi:ABC-type phosphate transport system auxiliary subunit
VQRWRATNPAFAERYNNLLAHRAEVLEELALQRAATVETAPRFYRGKQIATIERHDNSMLMRVLTRFDRAREREQAKRDMDAEVERRVAAEKARLLRDEQAYRESIERTFGYRVDAEVRKRLSEMSPPVRLPERPFGGG